MQVALVSNNISADGVGVFTRTLCRDLAEIGVHSSICYVRRRGFHSCVTDIGNVDSRLVFKPYRRMTGIVVDVAYGLPFGPVFHYVNSFVPIPEGYNVYHFTSYVPFVKQVGRSVLTIHDLVQFAIPEVSGLGQRLRLRHFYKSVGRRSLFVHAISNYVKREILQYLGFESDQVEVVYPGVDTSLFKPVEVSKPNKTIMHVGRGMKKNTGFLIKVFNKLTHSFRDLWLVKVGYDKEDMELAAKLGVNKRIIWLKGISREELAHWYERADCFMFPSLHEGFGLVVLEAMACGTPVVVSSSGALPEVVGNSGIVVRGWNIDEWSETCLNILSSDSIRKELSRRGVERAKAFGSEMTARRMKELYDRYLGNL